jgi:acyl-CoA synthetase (AMP-forming)/AMP-acid ligase II
MNMWLSLNKALTLFPERIGLADGAKHFTYREFGQRVARLSRALINRGMSKGSVAAVMAPNGHEFIEIYYACGITGVVLNPVNFRLSPREISDILQDCQVKLLFAHVQFKEAVAAFARECNDLEQVIWLGGKSPELPELPQASGEYEAALGAEDPTFPPLPELKAGDLAHLYYTSGTTGRPKGVMLTQGNVSFHALAVVPELKLSDADAWLHAAPMFHLADAWSTFAVTWVGGKHVFVPAFNAGDVLETIERERVTATVMIPTMVNAMLNHPEVGSHDYSSLRMIMTGGAPIAPEVVKKIITVFGCDYIQLYGMTETSPVLTLSLLKAHMRDWPEDKQIAVKCTTGRPFIGAEVKVVRSGGAEVEWNGREVGEIIARGPGVTQGYWRQPEVTAATIKDGWLHTGDLAVIDSEGYISIVDRKKDMIITGGENVYSTEVEYALYEHPGVLECAVFGIPDQTWGEAVKAVVVPRPGHTLTESDIIGFVKARLAHYKAPRSVDFASELPKTGSGKIYKKALREPYWAGRHSKVL